MRWVDAFCPCCANRGLQEFYRVDGVPVNNCMILPTRREALDFPRADLRIALCEACGFVTNTAFSPDKLRYDAAYEESQVYSPTFAAFQDRLIGTLIERYDLRGRTIVEIGCGKGDFLARLCELGKNWGIGIDPTSVPERLTGEAADRVRFVNEFYGERHGAIPADFVCCRHALEHIPDVGDFVRLVRATVVERRTPVFFEIPDVLRVLHEAAYWDLYYEHCSYFTPGTLARLFEVSGFEVRDLRLDYDGQYVLLDAAAAEDPVPGLSTRWDQPDGVRRAVLGFERAIARRLDGWRSYFAEVRRSGKRVVIWGSGSKCVAFLTTLGVTDEVEYVTDVNPHRHGNFILGAGLQIVAPRYLRHYRPDEVIVMNPIYRGEIAAMLAEMGLGSRVVTADETLEALAS